MAHACGLLNKSMEKACLVTSILLLYILMQLLSGVTIQNGVLISVLNDNRSWASPCIEGRSGVCLGSSIWQQTWCSSFPRIQVAFHMSHPVHS